jgi:hypothetical protein
MLPEVTMYKSSALWFGLFVVCCILLFQTSQRVTDGRQKLSVLQRDLMDEEETLRVLQAEWSYLNQPERLEKLSREYLKLAPMKGQQFAKADSLPLRAVPEDPATQVALTATQETPLTATTVAVTAAEIAAVDKTSTPRRPSKRPASASASASTSSRPTKTPAVVKAADRAYQPPQPAPAPARVTNTERGFGDVIQSLGIGAP